MGSRHVINDLTHGRRLAYATVQILLLTIGIPTCILPCAFWRVHRASASGLLNLVVSGTLKTHLLRAPFKSPQYLFYYLFILIWGLYLTVFRVYYWLGAQGSLLVMLRDARYPSWVSYMQRKWLTSCPKPPAPSLYFKKNFWGTE